MPDRCGCRPVRSAARRTAHGVGIGLSEANTIGSNTVDMGRVQIGRSVATSIERALIVGIENDNIRLVGLRLVNRVKAP